jgi:hypothetical protein
MSDTKKSRTLLKTDELIEKIVAPITSVLITVILAVLLSSSTNISAFYESIIYILTISAGFIHLLVIFTILMSLFWRRSKNVETLTDSLANAFRT